MKDGPRHTDVTKGVAIGLAAGLVGTWAMTTFQTWWTQSLNPEGHPDRGSQGTPESEHYEPATEKVADTLSHLVNDRDLDPEDRKTVGNRVHYTFGASTGAVYGATVEAIPAATALGGLVFGTLVWVLGDNLAVPGLGLAPKASKHPASERLYGLLAHLVYGAATEATRRALRSIL